MRELLEHEFTFSHKLQIGNEYNSVVLVIWFSQDYDRSTTHSWNEQAGSGVLLTDWNSDLSISSIFCLIFFRRPPITLLDSTDEVPMNMTGALNCISISQRRMRTTTPVLKQKPAKDGDMPDGAPRRESSCSPLFI